MRTIKELKEFYNTTLLGDLKVLEMQRKEIVRKIYYTGFFCFCAIVVSLILTYFYLPGEPALYLLEAFGISAIFVWSYRFVSRDYVVWFKAMIIEKLVKFMNENLEYKPNDCIDKSTFMMSRIFRTEPNNYKGDDLVYGTIGRTKIKFSELNAIYEGGSGSNRRRYKIFKGLFFMGDFNKHFIGQTIVLPDIAERLWGRLGKKLQAMNIFRGQLVKLEDPEFEKEFAVYGSNQIEARYVLSTSLMRRILEFKWRTGKEIFLSFVGSMVFVAVSYKKDLFEPKVFQSLLRFGPIREYFEDLSLAIGIVDELNLNTRIWSKQ
jgi:hypothetical protein